MTPNMGLILFNAPLYPPSSKDPTIIPNKGNPTPVITKPIIAGQKNCPLENLNSEGRLSFLRQKYCK